jgi:hypothetical protein
MRRRNGDLCPPLQICKRPRSELERKTRKTLACRPRERVLVLLRGVLVERGRERVAHLGELVRGDLHQVEKRRVVLLGLVALRVVVGPLGLVGSANQVGVVVLE